MHFQHGSIACFALPTWTGVPKLAFSARIYSFLHCQQGRTCPTMHFQRVSIVFFALSTWTGVPKVGSSPAPKKGPWALRGKTLSKSNKTTKSSPGNAGFTDEERKGFDKIISKGFIDTFREYNLDPRHYSWWSYRANARAKNLGWRIDYNMISEGLLPKLKRATILSQVKHSDHCPVFVEIAD